MPHKLPGRSPHFDLCPLQPSLNIGPKITLCKCKPDPIPPGLLSRSLCERSLVISVLFFGHYLPAPPLALSAVPRTHLPWAPCLGPSSPGTTVWLQVLAMCHLLKEATLFHAAASPSTLRQMGDTCGHGGLSLPPVPTPFIQSPLSSPSSNRQPMGCSREVRRPPSRGHVRICSPKPCSHQERKPGPASWRRRDHGEGDRAVLTEPLLNQLATTS